MRLLAALCLAEIPFTVAVWSALHWDAVGAENGVLWCACLLGGIVALGVVAAHFEPKPEPKRRVFTPREPSDGDMFTGFF